MRGFAGETGEAHIIAQQTVLRDRIIKAWTAERKEQIRKYQAMVEQGRRVSDGINNWIVNKGRLSIDQMEKIQSDYNNRMDEANQLMKDLAEDYRQTMMKAGVTTALGYNYYDLRGPAFLIYPVNTPFRNMLPRWGRQNAGVGTAVHWKYTGYTGPTSTGTGYAGAKEGERVAYSTPGETDATATYAELGVERSVSFTAEFAGDGYTDNVSDEHIRGLHQFMLQEESIILGGNAGTASGNNGFALGTANTPSAVLAASIPASAQSDGSTSGFNNNTIVTAYVIELTMLGFPTNGQFGYQAAPTVGATGLTPSYSRSNADSTSDTINGGMGALSAASSPVTAITSTPFVKFSVVPKKGAIAWAWYVNDTDGNTPTTAHAYLAGITTIPVFYAGSKSDQSQISTNQAANATGLNADKSQQSLDFSGILAWIANGSGTWINMSDISKTNPATGSTYTGNITPGLTSSSNAIPAVVELEYDLKQQWNSFQAVADELWCDAATKLLIAQCLFKNTSGVPAYRFEVTRDAQGNILGGFTVSGYKNQYSMKETGSEEIPIRIHPMIPTGSWLLRKSRNPYPHSRIPGVSGLFVQRDVYGIEWPVTTRAWTFGTYAHETYGDYIPGLLTFRTGITGTN